MSHFALSEKDKELLQTIAVLYVEDEEDIREELSAMLTRRVGTLYTASHGQMGLEIFKTYKPDIVITDVRMPVMDGLLMSAEVKKINDNTPIIITTASNEIESLIKAIDIGIDKYVLKPTDINLLLEAMAKFTRILSQKREIDGKNRYIQFLLDVSPAFIVTTEKNNIEYINQTFLSFFGYPSLEDFKEEHKSIDDFILKIDEHPFPDKDFQDWIRYTTENKDTDHVVYLKTPQDPENSKAFLLTYNNFPLLDKYVMFFTDITQIEKEKAYLMHQATFDSLTAIYNRSKFNNVLITEAKRVKRYDTTLSLIIFDIDKFKNVNDTYGHVVGDTVLKELAVLVSQSIREHDILSRWGGEEFIILTPEVDLSNAQKLAEKLRVKIEGNQFTHAGSVTCSFGVAQFKVNDTTESFVKRADDMLYKAKRNGRNRVCSDENSL